MNRRTLAVTVAVAAALIVLPSSASAATTCTFAGGVVDIDVTNGTFQVAVKRNGSDITINDPFVSGSVSCAGGTPTVNNADTIDFDESATTGQGTSLHIDLTGGSFEPGLTDEPGSSDEVEVAMNTDNDGTDSIYVTGGGANDNVRLGALGGANQGVNLNGAEADGVDVDVTVADPEQAGADGNAGADTITADGSGGAGLAFTGLFPVDVNLSGGTEDDTLTTGGGGNNHADGEAGNDTLTGGPNSDDIDPDVGNDTVNGGGNTDYVSYLNHDQGVTVDLRTSAPQDTGGAGTDTISNVEGVVGSNAADTLIGTSGANPLYGGQLSNDTGADELIGLDGPDELRGAAGDDVLVGGGGDDTLSGAEGTDSADYSSGSTGGITFSLDPAKTGVSQPTGGAGSDTLADSLLGLPSDPDANHEVENIVGSEFADDLTGNQSDNEILGGDGADTISLLGGIDTFDAYDGGQDTVDCGGAADSGTADEQGVDVLAGCEATDFAPRASVADGPANEATVNDPTPTYSLTADEPASFQVSVDGGAFGPCSASCEVPSLSDGAHTIAFRAVDADEAGNPGLNSVTRTVTVDTSAPPQDQPGNGTGEPTDPPDETPSDQRAPETTVKQVKVRGDAVTVRFVSDEPGSSFDCRLDGKRLRPCTSPKRYRNLDRGKHTFQVVAIDAAGNRDPSAAKKKIEIEGGNS